jgi:hypothetical protein
MTRWWVIRLGTRPSSPNPRPKLHGLIHMRIQMIEVATKLGSTRLKAFSNYHLQAKRIASEVRASTQSSLGRTLRYHSPHAG